MPRDPIGHAAPGAPNYLGTQAALGVQLVTATPGGAGEPSVSAAVAPVDGAGPTETFGVVGPAFGATATADSL